MLEKRFNLYNSRACFCPGFCYHVFYGRQR
ncbi:hypothetical protein [Klebsiella phage 05F01]|nr:hypothetical protein [Klebsiella phage 05F01]